MDINILMEKVEKGFESVPVGDTYKKSAKENIQRWLTEEQFSEYVPQIVHMIEKGYWDYILDSFYQVIPFGTGGRRGEVGIGPNRINPWTIQSSAQGHSQYLQKQYGDEAKRRGVVLTFDVRQFFSNKYFNDDLPNPVFHLNCEDLARAAAKVYTANGILVYLFDGFRTTPELSFAIRHLHAVSGDMFSASHNPPEHNGKKVYDEFGGQLIPPFDEKLVHEVTENVREIKRLTDEEFQATDLLKIVGEEVDNAYILEVSRLSLSKERDISIVYTPLHGCGSTSVLKALEHLKFSVHVDPKTGYASGKFENVTFNIPNPEVIQSFDAPLEYAKEIHADIILNSDPDADRIGIMVLHKGKWVFVNGNEIAGILAAYVIEKKKPQLKGKRGIIIKTDVTTNLMTVICKKNDVEIIGDLLVGFKYIGAKLNELEKEGKIDEFLMACEESHGYVAGNYVRDKDAVVPAIWLSELCAELKKKGKTLIDYLEDLYATYGFYKNYLTEIRLPGAEGMEQIQKIQNAFREKPPKSFGKYTVKSMDDWQDRLPIMSETDRVSKNAIVFHFNPVKGTTSMRVTVRPSGTEPKVKMYYEIGSNPFSKKEYEQVKKDIGELLTDVEKSFMIEAYKCIGVDFPERGFLLFWQLPLKDKMHYFEMEEEIVSLKSVSSKEERKTKLHALLQFLGSDPTKKVNAAFADKYKKTIEEYLGL